MPIIPIPDDAPKSEVKAKVNEIVEFLNSLDIKPKTPPAPVPPEWSQSRASVDNGWRPKNPEEPMAFWLDPTNFLVKRELVPQGEIEKWETEHTAVV